jgi:hypothetical protein
MGHSERGAAGLPGRTPAPWRERTRQAACAATCCVAMAAWGLLGPAHALAGSGVFCSSCVLSVHAHHIGNFRSHFYETETWNSDGKGVGSCSGVGSSGGSYVNVACHGDATGYNEVYCTACNGDTNWYSIMENNSNHGYTSVFTGWESYA